MCFMASFQKLKTGWKYRISYKDKDGQYKIKSRQGFQTKKDAELAAARVEELLNAGKQVNHNIVFIDYMQRWYEVFKKDKYSIENNKDIEVSIRTAKKFFGQTKILDIDRYMYQEFINWYGQGRSDATVKKVHTYTKACLLDALNDGVIHKDPTYRIKAKGTKNKKNEKAKFLHESEVKKLIDYMYKDLRPSYHSRYAILLALFTGLRFSELIALSWDDIDFKDKTLTVNKTFDYKYNKQFKKTKTNNSNRTIGIDNQTIALLKKFKLGNQMNQSGYIFLDNMYNHVSNSAVNKCLKKACKKLDITVISFHGLRHTHCSLLLYHGLNIKYISSRLGHSSVSITMNIYSHILDELEDKESEKVNQIISHLVG